MDLYFCILCFSFVSSTIFFFHFLSSAKRRIQNYLKSRSQRRSSHHFLGDKNFIMQSLMERLRSVVSIQGWDYCVVWKLSQDHSFLYWMCCFCSGTGNAQNGGDEELVFPVSRDILCRDTMFHHPRTNSCDFLDQLPSSIPLDSGIYAETLLSNQPNWLGFNNNADSSVLEHIGTRVLIPIPGALVEFFVAKKVSEDQQVIDFITAQCNISLDEDMLINQLGYNSMENQKKNDTIFQGSQDSFLWDKEMNPFKSSIEDGIHEAQNVHIPLMEPLLNKEQQDDDKDQIKHEGSRLESLSDCSNNEDDAKYGQRTGQGPTSKNLDAERRRRKKLNERLYNLRGLVPKISKMDKASILGDAIEFVKELKRQAKELQDELEQQSDDEGAKNNGINGNEQNIVQGIRGYNGVNLGPKNKNDLVPNNFDVGKSCNGSISKQNQDSTTANDKARQMEPSVEVGQTDGNEFFVKVFCEHKPGGFVRLIEALNSLGLEITDANVTCFRLLVSNVFKVKKKSSEIVQAHQVRDFLLELMRNPSKNWFEMANLSEDNSGLNMSHPHYQPISTYHSQSLLH